MVKCKDCAMLGILDLNGKRVPLSMRTRETGQYHDHNMNKWRPIADTYCWRRQRDFTKEELKNSKGIVSALDEEIECQEFETYIPGTTPIEVDEMTLRDSIANLQREMGELRRDEIARQKDTVIAQKNAELARKDAEAQLERRFRTNLIVQFLLALLAAAVVLIGSKILPFWTI